ncbi:hypothetical protein [sulfur-oxidizing endosymbiont of Gigantopelta aegis]|uniref:hypothetical protein n=1 Tax=sulfur-oxidizing endosymbiont of Gigantopelta aegis TaxID=2794934 RepID=UPI001BE3EDA6|nr:hypothetical protein [sulfur-oxidizing endosymbiont of Gigantopelta aegis]
MIFAGLSLAHEIPGVAERSDGHREFHEQRLTALLKNHKYSNDLLEKMANCL